MSEAVVDDIVAVLPPLLQSLEALAFVARHLNPPDFDRVMDAVGAPDDSLRTVGARLARMARERSPTCALALVRRATQRWRLSRGCARCSMGMAIWSPCFAPCATRRVRRKRCIRWRRNFRRSATSSSIQPCATTKH